MLTFRGGWLPILMALAAFPGFLPGQELELSPGNPELDSGVASEAELLPLPREVERKPASDKDRPQGYCLAAGDTLAIIVHGVIGKFGQAPTHFPNSSKPDLLPATGYPITVQDDGCLHLPQIEAVDVTGLNVVQAQQLIAESYLTAGITRKPHMVMLSLLRKRKVNVTVVHSSASGGRVDEVHMDADRAGLIHALAGGGSYDPHAAINVYPSPSGKGLDGNLIQLSSPAPQFYYTGGLVAGGQHRLPVDRPLNVLQAISIAGGVEARVIPARQIRVVSQRGPTRVFSMREVLRNPDAVLVSPGDHILVR